MINVAIESELFAIAGHDVELLHRHGHWPVVAANRTRAPSIWQAVRVSFR